MLTKLETVIFNSNF